METCGNRVGRRCPATRSCTTTCLPHGVPLPPHADAEFAEPRREVRLAAAEPRARAVLRRRRRVEEQGARRRVVAAGQAALDTGLDALADADQRVPRRREEERVGEVDGHDEDAERVVGVVGAAVGAHRHGHPGLAAHDVDVDEVDRRPRLVRHDADRRVVAEGGLARGALVADDGEAAVEVAAFLDAEWVGDADVVAPVWASRESDRPLLIGADGGHGQNGNDG